MGGGKNESKDDFYKLWGIKTNLPNYFTKYDVIRFTRQLDSIAREYDNSVDNAGVKEFRPLLIDTSVFMNASHLKSLEDLVNTITSSITSFKKMPEGSELHDVMKTALSYTLEGLEHFIPKLKEDYPDIHAKLVKGSENTNLAALEKLIQDNLTDIPRPTPR